MRHIRDTLGVFYGVSTTRTRLASPEHELCDSDSEHRQCVRVASSLHTSSWQSLGVGPVVGAPQVGRCATALLAACLIQGVARLTTDARLPRTTPRQHRHEHRHEHRDEPHKDQDELDVDHPLPDLLRVTLPQDRGRCKRLLLDEHILQVPPIVELTPDTRNPRRRRSPTRVRLRPAAVGGTGQDQGRIPGLRAPRRHVASNRADTA
jgi:hypothetical protein